MMRFRTLAAALAAGLLQATITHAAITPYTSDGGTLHLWHFDDVSNPAVDSAGSENLTLSGGATLGATALSGFGTAMDVSASLSTAAGAYGSLDVSPTGFVTDVATGAFTMEALIRPTIAMGSISDNMQIISLEQDGAGARSFQFRIEAGSGDLDFINITGGSQPAQFALPTTGPDAYEDGAWYHVAVTYDGNAGAADNFKYYWTKVTPGRTRANLLGVTSMGSDLGNGGDFAIGNEARDTSEDSFAGQIDETRISSAVREADQFIFGKQQPAVVLLADNFNTTDTADINADLGSRQSGLLATTTYSQLSDGATIVSNAASFGSTGSSTISPNVNFADGAAGTTIANGGGFIIDFDVNPVSGTHDTGTDTDWFAISFGHPSATPSGVGTYLLNGSSDFGILFRDNGQFQMFDNGANVTPSTAIFDANPFAGEIYNIRLLVETTGAASGTGVVRLYVNGVAIDLTNAVGLGYNFTWDAGGDNYIVFESRNEPAVFDNLLIAAIPTPAALPAGVALMALMMIKRRR